jgi:hypothetical protein
MKKSQNALFVLILLLSIFLHFYKLPTQEFTGDEVSPMLLIDRMWDGVFLKDLRFLGYPFLFYHEPYRAMFSGTILHVLGPDRIAVRLPSIFFALLTLSLLFWIFKKENITPWIAISSITSYSISPLIFHDRTGGGDAQTRFLFLLTGYLAWKAYQNSNVKNFRLSLITMTIGILTMLDTIVILPAIIIVFLRKKFFSDKKTLYLVVGAIVFLGLYFSAWLTLPYLAFKSDFQNYYQNRGLFYYFSRIGGGIGRSPLDGIQSLVTYTDILFTIWVLAASFSSLKIKKFLIVNAVGVSAWIAVLFLSNSSSHILSYVSFFFFQAVLVTNHIIKKISIAKPLFIIFIIFIIVTNTFNLFTNYFSLSKSPPGLNLARKVTCLNESVIRTYKDHDKKLEGKPCEPADAN